MMTVLDPCIDCSHGIVKRPFYESCNQEKYNSTVPPTYDLTKVTCPNVMFLGKWADLCNVWDPHVCLFAATFGT